MMSLTTNSYIVRSNSAYCSNFVTVARIRTEIQSNRIYTTYIFMELVTRYFCSSEMKSVSRPCNFACLY